MRLPVSCSCSCSRRSREPSLLQLQLQLPTDHAPHPRPPLRSREPDRGGRGRRAPGLGGQGAGRERHRRRAPRRSTSCSRTAARSSSRCATTAAGCPRRTRCWPSSATPPRRSATSTISPASAPSAFAARRCRRSPRLALHADHLRQRQRRGDGDRLRSADRRSAACVPPRAIAARPSSVRELFENVPARRKFLRSADAEFRSIVTIVSSYALPLPDARVPPRAQRPRGARSPARDDRPRARRCRSSAARPRSISPTSTREIGVTRASGFVTRGLRFGSRRNQYFFVNGRLVKDRVLTHAANRACEAFDFEGHPGDRALRRRCRPRRST